MPWTTSNVPTAAKNLPARAKRIFVTAANQALSRGKSDGDAVRIGLIAVRNAGYYRDDAGNWKFSEDQRRSSAGNPTKKQDDEAEYDVEAMKRLVQLAQLPNWARGKVLDTLGKVSAAPETALEGTLKAEMPENEPQDTQKAAQTLQNEQKLQKNDGVKADMAYKVVSKAEEKRYTLGPVYSPGTIDAHGEQVTADDLQEAMWEFVSKGDRTVRLQHTDRRAGEWVELVTWPASIKTGLAKSDGETEEVEFPAGTVFMGVLWDEDVWPLVKSGALTGYSMGGRATRVEVEDHSQD